MTHATAHSTTPHSLSGWINGALGVIIFSGSLPATRVAVLEMDPFLLTFLRATIAGLLALLVLRLFPGKRPRGAQIISLVIVALGVVLGFPLLTAMALQYVTAAHSIVFLGLLPLSTATFAVVRGGERPPAPFWLFSVIGCVLVAGFALTQNGASFGPGDLLMLAAIVVCGLGYAEGARLTRELGGWRVISWALVIALPPMLVATLLAHPVTLTTISPRTWVALGYVSLFSMLIGFIFWYQGLAAGGIAAVGQLQLLQPLLGLLLSAVLLQEAITPSMLVITLGVILCVIGSRRYSRDAGRR